MKRADKKSGKLSLKNFTVAKYDRAETVKGGGGTSGHTRPSIKTIPTK